MSAHASGGGGARSATGAPVHLPSAAGCCWLFFDFRRKELIDYRQRRSLCGAAGRRHAAASLDAHSRPLLTHRLLSARRQAQTAHAPPVAPPKYTDHEGRPDQPVRRHRGAGAGRGAGAAAQGRTGARALLGAAGKWGAGGDSSPAERVPDVEATQACPAWRYTGMPSLSTHSSPLLFPCLPCLPQ